jgi:hypothetical protein
MKVVELVTAQQANAWSPEELRFQFPYLSLGQIHSALAYYFDHKASLDADIARRLARCEGASQHDQAGLAVPEAAPLDGAPIRSRSARSQRSTVARLTPSRHATSPTLSSTVSPQLRSPSYQASSTKPRASP